MMIARALRRGSRRSSATISVATWPPPIADKAKLPMPYLPYKVFATGLVSGCGGSLVGLGGAFVTIPALTSRWVKLTQHQAQATSLAGVLATGAGVAVTFASAGVVDWNIAMAITGGGMVTANLGAQLATKLPGHTMKGLLGVFMVCAASAVLAKSLNKGTSEQAVANSEAPRAELSIEKVSKLLAIGCGVGIFAGVFGVGGGAISVPAVALSFPELSHHEALGTSCAAMVLPAVSGLARHARTGALVLPAVLPLAVGNALGAMLGSKYISLQLDEATLRCFFSGLLAILGMRTMQSAWTMRSAALKVVGK